MLNGARYLVQRCKFSGGFVVTSEPSPAQRVYIRIAELKMRRWFGILIVLLVIGGGLGWILTTSDHTADRNVPGSTTTSGRSSLASPDLQR